MKKILVLIFSLLIFISGCNNSDKLNNKNEKDKINNNNNSDNTIIDNDQKQPLDQEVIDAYHKATEVINIFTLNSLDCDYDDSIVINDNQYFKVLDFDNLEIFKEYCQQHLDISVLESYYQDMIGTNKSIIEVDGILYTQSYGRGTDIYKGEETYRIELVADNSIKFIVNVELLDDDFNVYQYEDYLFAYENIGEGWKFYYYPIFR